jgi:hypothetical protein
LRGDSEYLRRTELAADVWLTAPLTAPPSHAVCVLFDLMSLHMLRPSLLRFAIEAGMSEARMADLVLAVNEIASSPSIDAA